jgi:hypothetical protein
VARVPVRSGGHLLHGIVPGLMACHVT